jgi:Spy/CpxP family protein refolding chaperone
MGGPMGPGFGAGLVLGELNLTEAQREQVRQIRDRHRDETRSVADRLAAARDKQQKAVETIPPDEALITSLTQDMVQAEVDAALLQARLNAEVWAVLTPEQQAQATKLRAERQARMDQRRQQMQQRRPQGK